MRVLSWRLRLAAAARPRGVAWVDGHGSLTWAQLDAAVDARARAVREESVVSRAGTDGAPARQAASPVLTTSETGRDAWITTLAGIRAGTGAVLASPTLGREALGSLSTRSAPAHGVVVSSSGTTGPPKQVHRTAGPAAGGQLAALASRLPVRGVTTVACLAPVDRGHGFQAACLALLAGVRFVDLARLDADVALSILREWDVQLLTGVPVHLSRLLAGDGSARVRDVVSGSDVLPPSMAAGLRGRLGARVWSCYGSTETGTVTVASPTDLAAAPTTVGRPIRGVRIEERDGLLAIRSPLGGRRWHTLDRGHVDAAGRVFVTGRP